MKPDALVRFSESFLADYFRYFTGTIIRPGHQFSPLNPRLFSFLLANMWIGTSLLGIQHPEFTKHEFLRIFATTLVFWFFGSAFLHLCFNAHLSFNGAGGRPSFFHTLTVGLQLFSVIFVVASLFTVLWASCVSAFELDTRYFYYLLKNREIPAYFLFVNKPIYAYFAFQAVLILIYTPISFRHAFSLRYYIAIAAGIWVSLFFVALNILIFIGAGERRAPAMALGEYELVVLDVSGSMDFGLLLGCWNKLRKIRSV